MPSSYWLNGYTYEGDAVEVFRYQPPKEPGQKEPPEAIVQTLAYSARSSWQAQYDGEGAAVYRKEIKSTPWGETYSETYTTYSNDGDTERVISTTYVYARREAITQACGFPSFAVIPLPGNIAAAGGTGTVLVEKLVNESVAQEESVINTEYRSAAVILTANGAAAIQQQINSWTELYNAAPKNFKPDVAEYLAAEVPEIVRFALTVVPDKTRVQYAKKKKEESLKDQLGGGAPLTDENKASLGIMPGSGAGDLIDELDPEEGFTNPEESDPELDLEDEEDAAEEEDEDALNRPFDPSKDFTSGKVGLISHTQLSTNTAIITTRSKHTFSIDDEILVQDTDDADYTGTYTVLATPSETQLTYRLRLPDKPLVESGGNILVTDAIENVLTIDKYFLIKAEKRALITTTSPHGLSIGDNVLIQNLDYLPRGPILMGYWSVSGVENKKSFYFDVDTAETLLVDDPEDRGTVTVVGYKPADPSFPSSSTAGAVINTALTGNVATITTKGNHGFAIGDEVIIQCTTDLDYSGTRVVTTTPTEQEFTFALALPNKASAPSGGTVIKSTKIKDTNIITKTKVKDNVATITTAEPHGLDVKSSVLIQCTPDKDFEGPWGVTGVPSPTTFTFKLEVPDKAATDSTGTVVTVGTTPTKSYVASSRSGAISTTGLTDNVALITTKADHGFAIGDAVMIQCTTDPAYMGTHVVTSTPTETQFTFALNLPNKALVSSSGTVVRPDSVEDTTVITKTQVINKVATVTTASPHGLDVKSSVLIQCTPDKDYEGPWGVTGTPTPNTFTFEIEVPDKPLTDSSGTVVTLGTAPKQYYPSSSKAAMIDKTAVNNNRARIVTKARHGFAIGDVVVVQDTADVAYIGTHKITSTPSDTEFTYTLTTGNKPLSDSHGTVVKPDAIEKTVVIVSTSVADNTATINTDGPHGFVLGDNILIQGTDDKDYVGYWDVVGVPSEQSFTFELITDDKPLANSTGTAILVGYRPAPENTVPDREEITPPYIPDDSIVDSEDGKYEVIENDAQQKSLEYLRIQAALRLGYNRGQSIVHPVEYYRTAPFSPVYVSIKGITGQCRTDATTITFDETGILVSTSALFWGGVGQ